MDVRELVHAILAGDLIGARQLVADVQRMNPKWEQIEQPLGLSERELTIAAGITELLALRAGGRPPLWTQAIGPAQRNDRSRSRP